MSEEPWMDMHPAQRAKAEDWGIVFSAAPPRPVYQCDRCGRFTRNQPRLVGSNPEHDPEVYCDRCRVKR